LLQPAIVLQGHDILEGKKVLKEKGRRGRKGGWGKIRTKLDISLIRSKMKVRKGGGGGKEQEK